VFFFRKSATTPRMKAPRARIVLILLVAATAAAIRLAWLDSTPPWWDEFVTLGRARLPLADIWRSLTWQGPSDSSLDSSPPLLHFILHGVLALGGASGTWVKLPSILFGILTVLVLYPLGTRLFGGRSGLYASALLGLSLYHVHYSREARPYSLYLLLATSSLWLLLRAIDHNRFRDWGLWALAASLTLYASYLGGASLAAQAAWIAALIATRRLPRGRLLPAGAGFAAAALAYAPWLPGHIFQMEVIYSPNSGMGLTWEFLGRALSEFATESEPYLACAGLGLLVALRRRASGLTLLLFWLGLPLATALALRTGIAVNPRYLINFAPGLALLAGAGLNGLVTGLSLALPGRAAALLGLAAAVGLSWTSLTGLPDYYRRDQHSERDDLRAVAENAATIDTLAFARNRHLKVYARWYLPGVFGDLSHSGGVRYRRVLLLCQPDFIPQGFGRPESYGDLRAFRVGLVNANPLPASGTYRANFSDVSFYREAAFWDNTGPDLFQKTLSLYDPERPGQALWRFFAPPGGFPEAIPLRCRLRLTQGVAVHPPDASVAIVAGDGQGSPVVLRRVTRADFHGSELDISLDVPRPPGDDLTVGFALDPGTVLGSIEPLSLELDFPERPFDRSRIVRNLTGRVALAEWTPGVVRAGDDGLYAFKPDDPRLKDFLAEYPGISPVSELPGLLLFDPALTRPWLTVPGGRVLFAGRASGPAGGAENVKQARGMMVRGDMSGQILTLGGTSLELPLEAPKDSTLALAPGHIGRLWASMDFTTGPGEPFASFNLATSPKEPCLTCANENSCFVVYALRSRAPIRAVRVVYCPQAYGEPGQDNGVRLALSTDGDAYRTLDDFSVRGSELWEGKKRHVAWVRLDKPSERVYLRFELSGDKARLWAGPGYPMRIDAWLDPAASLPAKLPAGPFEPTSTGRPVRLLLSPNPLPDLDTLLAPH